MSDELRQRRMRIDDTIRLDPYRPDLLAKRALLSWSLGETDMAERDLRILAAFNRQSTTVRTIMDQIRADVRIESIDDWFAVSWPPDRRAALINAVRRTREVLQDFDMHASGSVIVFRWSEQPFHLARFDVADLAFIEVSSEAVNRCGLDGGIAHEYAHACLRSGSRFLDEGWAYLIQHRVVPELAHPADWNSVVRWSLDHPSVNVRALIAMPGGAGPLFEPFAQSAIEVKDWSARAAQLVSVMADHLGEGLVGLFRELAVLPPSAMAARIERTMSAGLDEMLPSDLVETRIWDAPQRERLANLARQALRTARIQRNSFFLVPALTTMHSLARVCHDSTLVRLFGQLLVTEVMLDSFSGKKPRLLNLIEAEIFADDLRSAGHTVAAHLLSGLAAQARIVSTDVALDRARWSVAARYHLEAAYAADPKDPEIILAVARQEFNTPQHFGGDHERGAALLAELEPHKSYAEEVQALCLAHNAKLMALAARQRA